VPVACICVSSASEQFQFAIFRQILTESSTTCVGRRFDATRPIPSGGFTARKEVKVTEVKALIGLKTPVKSALRDFRCDMNGVSDMKVDSKGKLEVAKAIVLVTEEHTKSNFDCKS
jgi:hypothetical protein